MKKGKNTENVFSTMEAEGGEQTPKEEIWGRGESAK